MAETEPFTIGAGASCTDGACGEVSRVVVDPVARVITLLAVAGAVVVVSAVIAHSVALLAMARSRSVLGGVLGVVVWYYIAAGAALAVGGPSVVCWQAAWCVLRPSTVPWCSPHAHLTLLGWLGLAIIGTQFMLWPTVR